MILRPRLKSLPSFAFVKHVPLLLICVLISWSARAHDHDHDHDHHDQAKGQKHSLPDSHHHNCRGHLTQAPMPLSPKEVWSKSRDHLPKYLSRRWETVLDKLKIEFDGNRNAKSTENEENGDSHTHTHAHAHAGQAGHPHEHADSQNTVAALILDRYPQAIVKVESMRKILFESSGSQRDQIASDQVYLTKIFATVWASLTVHTHEILTASKSKKTDFPRYFKILKTITEFDENAPVFSFYKIKRAIEGRFSIQEYIDCL